MDRSVLLRRKPGRFQAKEVDICDQSQSKFTTWELFAGQDTSLTDIPTETPNYGVCGMCNTCVPIWLLLAGQAVVCCGYTTSSDGSR